MALAIVRNAPVRVNNAPAALVSMAMIAFLLEK